MLKSRHSILSVSGIMIIVLAALLLFSACGASTKPLNAAPEAPNELAQDAALTKGAEYTVEAESAAAVAPTENEGAALPQDNRKIILNAEIYLETTEFDATVTGLRTAVEANGGYVSSSNSSAAIGGKGSTLSLVARIPAEQYSSFLKTAATTGTITNQNEHSEYVTTQYVDVQARLESLKIQEKRLLELAGQAASVQDLLIVQEQLTEVQYQIEYYTSILKTYDNLTAYSTITLYVTEVGKVTQAPAVGYGSRLAETFKQSWRYVGIFLQNLGLFLVAILPLLLFAGVVTAIVLALAKRSGNKRRAALATAQNQQPKPYQTAPAVAPEGKHAIPNTTTPKN